VAFAPPPPPSRSFGGIQGGTLAGQGLAGHRPPQQAGARALPAFLTLPTMPTMPAFLTVGGVQVKAAVATYWEATGLGPVLFIYWSKLAPFPPFSWMQWMAGYMMGLPTFYKYYIAWSLFSALIKRVVPGTYAQLSTGTWLGILKSFNTNAYNEEVVKRLQALLLKQAELQAPRGAPKPKLSQGALDALSQQARADPVFLDALGSTTALGMWHNLERTPLTDESLVQDLPRDSQARWLVQALREGYIGDVAMAARESALEVAANAAADTLGKLREAVDSAAFGAKNGVLAVGPGSSMARVQEASVKAAGAVEALQAARDRFAEAGGRADGSADRGAWQAKLQELSLAHASAPAVAAELRRLSQSIADGGVAS